MASFHPHYLTFTPYLPPPSAPVQVMAYADDITITSTHTSTSSAKKYIQPYLHKVFAWTKHTKSRQNNLHSVHARPYRTYEQSGHKIHNNALPMATLPKVLGLTLDPKLTYSTHIHNISVHTQKPLQIIKALTATGWGKQKETLMATYLQGSYETSSGVCLCHMVASCILDQHYHSSHSVVGKRARLGNFERAG